ncbi:MAG: 3'(2'),5'-bisphosphate nucleotidase CysQ [Streptosporangiaceae bacterium]|jgi:3'(2'), 5'-bisphosphate nucleotidase
MATEDDRLAHDLAAEAGRRLVALRGHGGEPDELRKAGDRTSHEFLSAELARLRPGDWVLSEEAADDPGRLTADRVWIVDPLDGTREFGDAGREDWAVHVALWERARPGAAPPGGQSSDHPRPDHPEGVLTAGAVALPAQDEVLSTVTPPPAPPASLSAYLPASSPAGRRGGRLRIVVSRTRPAPFLPRMAELLGADLIPLGSAGAKVAAVLQGHADAYVHAGGQYEWDSAAPVAVARAAGFHASRIDGRELSYNQADLLMPDILVCLPALAGALLDAIASAQPGETGGGQR